MAWTRQGWIYFAGTERSSIGGDVYRVKFDGSSLRVSRDGRNQAAPASTRR